VDINVNKKEIRILKTRNNHNVNDFSVGVLEKTNDIEKVLLGQLNALEFNSYQKVK
jgi:hypothetical protein